MLHWYLATTDAGPNEMGARRIIQADIASHNTRECNVIFTDFTCLQHAQHLIALSALKAADRCLASTNRTWKYYSSLATAAHVLRSLAKQVFSTWASLFGYPSAKENAKTLMPKAVSGRWQGCDRPEQRLLSCGEERLRMVLSGILGGPGNSKAKRARSSNQEVDDLAVEASKAYSERMTKWKKACLLCVGDRLWWRCIRILNTCRQPLSHLSNYLQKRQGQWGHVAQMCNGKARHIYEEFGGVWDRLLSNGCLDRLDGEEETGTDVQFARNLAPLDRVEPSRQHHRD